MAEKSEFLFDIKKLTPKITDEVVSSTSVQNKSKPSIFLFMTKMQAQAQGEVTLSLFNQYNCINSSDNTIDEEEYALFANGDVSFSNSIFQRDSFSSLEDSQKEKLSVVLGELGHKDKMVSMLDNINDGTEIDLSTLGKTNYNIDLSEYNTTEEQQSALIAAINDRYKTYNLNSIDLSTSETEADKREVIESSIKASCGEDSIYAQHFKRLSEGKFTEAEIKKYNLGNINLTAEQCARFAAIATEEEQTVAILSDFSTLDKDGRKVLVDNIDKFDSGIHSGLIAGVLSMSGSPEESELYAKSIMNQNVQISERSYAASELALKELYMNSTVVDAMNFVSNSSHFRNDTLQLCAYSMSNEVEKQKVKSGKITQKEYDDNYINHYAKTAHKIKKTSKAHTYVINNTNNSNRQKTMEILAENVHNIKNQRERESVIFSIKNSVSFNKEIAKKLNKSLENLKLEHEKEQEIKRIKERENRVSPNSSKGNVAIENLHLVGDSHLISFGEHSFIIASNEDNKSNLTFNDIKSYINNLYILLEQAENTKEVDNLKVKQEQMASMLSTLLADPLFQGSGYELALINKLSSCQLNTLVNVVVTLPHEVQDYLITKKVLSVKDIDRLINEGDRKLLSEKIQTAIKNSKTKSNL